MKIYFKGINFPYTNEPLLFDYDACKNQAVCIYQAKGTARAKDCLEIDNYLQNFEGILLVEHKSTILDVNQFSATYPFSLIKKVNLRFYNPANRLTHTKDPLPALNVANLLRLENLITASEDPTLWGNTLGWRSHFVNKRDPKFANYWIHSLISITSNATMLNNQLIGKIKNKLLDQLGQLFDEFLAPAFHEIDPLYTSYLPLKRFFKKILTNILTINPAIYNKTGFETSTQENPILLEEFFSNQYCMQIIQRARENYFDQLAELNCAPLAFFLTKNEPEIELSASLPSIVRTRLNQIKEVLQGDRQEIEELVLSIKQLNFDYIAAVYEFNKITLVNLEQQFNKHELRIQGFNGFNILACNLIHPRLPVKLSQRHSNLINQITTKCLDFLAHYYDPHLLPAINSTDHDFFIKDDLAQLIIQQFNSQFKSANERFKHQSNELIVENFYTVFCQVFKQKAAADNQLVTDFGCEEENRVLTL